MNMATKIVSNKSQLKLNEPMARYTSWRVGGNARQYYKPASVDDLIDFLQRLPVDEPLVWLGLGSNMLIRDGGIDGTVIDMKGINQTVEALGGNRIEFDAGVTCSKAARFCARNNMGGAEFLAGIPGTIGGALAMNAGAFEGETWNYVHTVNTIDRFGQLHTRQPDQFTIGYRLVKALNRAEPEWFVSAQFEFHDALDEAGKQRIKALLEKRNNSQPIGLPSCGSVFTNPENDYAARLIESAGLKGYCIGQACVSEKHANFIINTGGATATDIESLILYVQAQVFAKSSIELHTEVRVIGEKLS